VSTSTRDTPPSSKKVVPAASRALGRLRWGACAAFAVLLLLLPLMIASDAYRLGVLLQMTIYVALGLSWHLLAGYSGQYSFGHACFFGVGAYTTAILSYTFNISPWIGLVISSVAGGALGLIIGAITARLSGLFFGLVTFGTALILGTLASHYSSVTGGAAGMSLPLRPSRPEMMQFDTALPLVYLGLVLDALFLLTTVLILKRKIGLNFMAVRDDPVAAEASGVATLAVRIKALVISAAMAGVVGGLYAQSILFIDPSSAFGIDQSVNAIFPAIIGGMGSLTGPVIGGAVFILLREGGSILSNGNGTYSVLFYSVIVFLLLMVAPKGILGIARRLRRRLRAGGGSDE